MSHAISIPLGVMIARERISHPWQEYRWRPISVFLDAPSIDDWRELRRTDDAVHYHAATLPLELHRKETTAYCVNLANGEPSVYVVTREDPESGSEHPLDVHLVTASPFEAQPHASMGLDSVDCVAMPEQLVLIVQDFIDEHHVEETFKKRQRAPHLEPEKHLFGQEPIFALRKRHATMDKVNGTKGAKLGKTENE